jgi:hypothetical protein
MGYCPVWDVVPTGADHALNGLAVRGRQPDPQQLQLLDGMLDGDLLCGRQRLKFLLCRS